MRIKPVRIAQYGVMGLLALVMLAPLVVMVANSLKGDEFAIATDLGSFRAFLPGDSPGLTNYRDVLGDPNVPFLRFMMNTLIVVGSIVLLGVLVNSMAAFALARTRFRGQALMVGVLVALIIVPLESLVIPLLLMVNRVGWIDSYHVQIIPFIAHPFSIFLFYQFFTKLPKDLDDAARCDGASFFQIYWRVVMPLSLPVIATVAILQSLEYWNSFLWPLMVTRGPEYRPLSVAMAQYFGRDPRVWGDIMAFSVMTSLPILVLYFAFQRWFIQSVVGSAVKG